MFGKETIDNQIFSFFFPISEEESNTVLDYSSFNSDDKYQVFAVASLFSNNISDLNKYLLLGIQELKRKFNTTDLTILDRMKVSIFTAGDFVANKLIQENEEVEDVDLSVCLLAIKDGILYIWNDGSLNVRIYRGEESILVNSKNDLQYFGSSKIELGDILAISFGENLDQEDPNHEEYVLETKQPDYPVLFLDYQIDSSPDADNNLATELLDDEEVSTDLNEELKDSRDKEYGNRLIDDQMKHLDEEEDVEKDSKPKFAEKFGQGLNKFKDSTRNSIKNLNESGLPQKLKSGAKKGFDIIHNALLSLTSFILDLVYRGILGKNSHQLKRFQASYKKRNLQYLLILILFISLIYSVYKFSPRSPSTKPTDDKQVNTEDYRKSIEEEFTKLSTYFNSVQTENFDKSFNSLQDLINKAKANNFADTAFLDDKSKQILNYYDKLYKVTPISKIDGIAISSNIQNGAELADFSVIGNDIYAIDKKNNQIVKSTTMSAFEPFASGADKDLKNMTQLACVEDKSACYVMDEEKGLVYLDLETKKFSIFVGLTDNSKGVKEMIYIFDRIYTFVPAQGKVLRYDQTGDGGIKKPVPWNTEAGFGSNTVDFAIDTNIFELGANGVLRKFFMQVNDASFAGLGKITPVLGPNLQLAMTPVARDPAPGIKNRVYISDPNNKRVAVFEKDLNSESKFAYLGSYKYRGTENIQFNSFKEIILSQDEKFLFILENNSVYKIQVTQI